MNVSNFWVFLVYGVSVIVSNWYYTEKEIFMTTVTLYSYVKHGLHSLITGDLWYCLQDLLNRLIDTKFTIFDF